MICIHARNGSAPTVRVLVACFAAGLVLAGAMTGCQYQAAARQDANAVGSYALIEVNGQSVPCQATHGGASLTIKSGAFVINADGTCASHMVFAVNAMPETTREVKGTYTRKQG